MGLGRAPDVLLGDNVCGMKARLSVKIELVLVLVFVSCESKKISRKEKNVEEAEVEVEDGWRMVQSQSVVRNVQRR